jgi:hypothetical protein
MLALCTAALAVLGAPRVESQDEDAALARAKAIELRGRCMTLLDDVDGVTSVNYAGAGNDYRLMVVVRDPAARQAARKKTGGDTWEGMPILWSVTHAGSFTKPATTTVAAPPEGTPPPPNAPAEPAPAKPSTPAQPGAEIPDCDILRAQMGLPPLHRMVGGGSWKSWIPCKVWLRAVQGAGGGHSYLYTKHRPGCPFQDGLASGVYREGFLYPTELRGSDLNWARQVEQDLQSKFPPPPPPMRTKETPYRPDTPSKP